MINGVYTDKKYCNDINSMVVFAPSNYSLLFLLGILNSRLISFWFYKVFDKLQRGIFPQFKVNELSQFPIPQLDLSKKADKGKHDRFVSLVEKINNQSLPDNELNKINEQIEKIVYELFGLSKDEIAVIENSYQSTRNE
jgi:hypothetical protein